MSGNFAVCRRLCAVCIISHFISASPSHLVNTTCSDRHKCLATARGIYHLELLLREECKQLQSAPKCLWSMGKAKNSSTVISRSSGTRKNTLQRSKRSEVMNFFDFENQSSTKFSHSLQRVNAYLNKKAHNLSFFTHLNSNK